MTSTRITEMAICQMVDTFYRRVREDDLLSSVFESRLAGHWEEHMPRMYAFWTKALLGHGEFQGNVFAKHMTLPGLREEHFARWLELFRQTCVDLFGTETAKAPIGVAENIATSFKLGYFSDFDALRRLC
jgi:hemoglobin